MSAHIMSQVWGLELTKPKQSVLLAMADHADSEGDHVRPGTPLIAWKTGYSERHTRRIIDDLVADGLLVVISAPPGKATTYRIDLSAGVQKAPLHPCQDSVTPDIATPDIAASPVPLTNEHVTPDIAVSGKPKAFKNNTPPVQTDLETQAEPAVVVSGPMPEGIEDRPEIYAVYEQAFGPLTQHIGQELKALVEDFTFGWVDDAFKIAQENNRRTLAYVKGILKRWQTEGRDAPAKPKGIGPLPRVLPPGSRAPTVLRPVFVAPPVSFEQPSPEERAAFLAEARAKIAGVRS